MSFSKSKDPNEKGIFPSSLTTISSFKRRRSFEQRKKESERIRELYPIKIPVIIERFQKDNMLPVLDRSKFLISSHVEFADLIHTIRRRLQLQNTQALFLVVNGRNIPGSCETLREIYEKEKDDDGFLYISYASQEVFG